MNAIFHTAKKMRKCEPSIENFPLEWSNFVQGVTSRVQKQKTKKNWEGKPAKLYVLPELCNRYFFESPISVIPIDFKIGILQNRQQLILAVRFFFSKSVYSAEQCSKYVQYCTSTCKTAFLCLFFRQHRFSMSSGNLLLKYILCCTRLRAPCTCKIINR
jgi:hypothetical protein